MSLGDEQNVTIEACGSSVGDISRNNLSFLPFRMVFSPQRVDRFHVGRYESLSTGEICEMIATLVVIGRIGAREV